MWLLSQDSVLSATPSAPCVSGFGFLPTRWTTKVSFPLNDGGNMTKFVPHEASKLIACGRLTSVERSVVHRADPRSGFRVSGIRVRVSCFVLRISGSWFLGFGFQVPAVEFRFPGSGFRVQDSGVRVWGCTTVLRPMAFTMPLSSMTNVACSPALTPLTPCSPIRNSGCFSKSKCFVKVRAFFL